MSAISLGPRHDRQILKEALLASVASLHRRNAAQIPEGFIDGYVALDWMEWHGGDLRLTTTGENICRQLTSERR